MPARPGVDDDPELAALIDLWREGSADLDARLALVYREILREIRADVPETFIINRLRIQARRLEVLAEVAEQTARGLSNDTQQWIDGGGVARVYAAGAAVAPFPFQFSLPHRGAVAVLADDLFADVLAVTRYVSDDSRRWVQRVGRKMTGFRLTGGTPVRAQARRFEADLRREFRRRGIGSVRYANGRGVSFGTYAEMLLRTKTGMAYNAGTLIHSARSGVEVVQIFDGPSCGLGSHKGSPTADGLVLPLEVAAAYPLSHPNCRRSIGARPDLNRSSPEVAPVVLPEENGERRAFNAALRLATDRTQQTV